MNKTAIIALLICTAAFAQQKGTFTDTRDKKTYKTVNIGKQTWMAENLNYSADGSKCYDNKPANCDKYGKLYNWNTANKACPSGWHLPSIAEWDNLFRYVDGKSGTKSPYKSEMGGEHLKTKSGWEDGIGNGTDKYGFAALPGGAGFSDGVFGSVGAYGHWWSSSNSKGKDAYYRLMGCEGGDEECTSYDSADKSTLFSVRCLQD